VSQPLRGLDVAFVLCVERGVLEAQALLLCASVRHLTGDLAGAPIYALSPRGRHPPRETLAALTALGVLYDDRPLNEECADYGSANRVAAAAHVERTTGHELLVVLDSDTLFLDAPTAFALPASTVAAVRPVDLKGMCTAGGDDPCDRYWRQLCDCCGVSYDVLPWLTTSVDQERVKACYNGGLVVVRRAAGILERWWELFLRSVRRGLRPWSEPPRVLSSTGMVDAAAARWWGSNQAALSLALWSSTGSVELLPPGYNYPLHLHERAPAGLREGALGELVHVHYHYLFGRDSPQPNPLLDPVLPVAAPVREWLRARLPLPATWTRGGERAQVAGGLGADDRVSAASDGGGVVSGTTAATGPARWGGGPSSRQLVIAGMHRSATSLVASVLRAAGVDVGRSVTPGVGNPRGHFEDAEVRALHDEALAARGASWLDVRPLAGAAVTRWEPPFRWRAQALVAARTHLPLWGWKDPRTVIFLDAWHELLPAPSYVALYRHPVEVAISLWRRGNDPQVRAEPWLPMVAWQHYNERLLDFVTRHRERCLLLHVPTIAGDLPSLVRRVAERFDLPLGVQGVEDLFAAAELSVPGAIHPGWQRLIPEGLAVYRRLEAEADVPSTASTAPSGGAGRSLSLERRERDLWRASEAMLYELLSTHRALAEIEGSRSYALVRAWWRWRQRWSAGGR
jgi:hypothetical protein